MPWFYVDDAFADSKPVMRLDARLRNEAVGLWTRCGAWSAKEETDGRVPIDVVRGFGGNKRLIEALANQAELWHPVEYDRKWGKTREILFQNWEKWQKTHAENEAKRKADAERQARHRKGQKGKNYVKGVTLSSADEIPSQRDTEQPDGDDSKFVSRRESQTPYPDPTHITTYVDHGSSLNVGSEERGLSAPVSVSASRLVATLIPDKIPAAVRTALRLKASELMNRDHVTADDMADALRKWLTKPDAGPGLLPNFVSDVQRARAAPPNGKPHKLRVAADLARQLRAEENAAAITNQPRKELP